MEETSSISKKHHQLLKEDQNPSKFYTHFLFKALAVTIFCITLPLFTSQTPELANQTRFLEFLHLVFVGIAVSYGLFSRRNDDSSKENTASSNNHTFDTAHSYVSRILQVSSVFNDHHVNEDGSEPSDEVIDTVETWRNRYYRKEPEVVVAKDETFLGVSSRISEKPLFLPVRSLKSTSLSDSGPDLTSKKFSRSLSDNSGNGDVRGSTKELPDDIVLPSPIPWRSRSGRLEVDSNMGSSHSVPPKESGVSRFEPQPSKQKTIHSTPASSAPFPLNSTPSPSLSSPRKPSPFPNHASSESLAKSAEDFVRKKSTFYGAFPPPPPPPPPPIHRPLYKSLNCPKKDSNGRYTRKPRESDGIKLAEISLLRPRVQPDNSSSDDSIIRLNQDRIFENGFKESPKKSNGFDQEASNKTETQRFETKSSRLPSKAFEEYREEEYSSFLVRKDIETDDEDMYSDEDDENDDTGASKLASQILGSSDINDDNQEDALGDEGPDVDKKADEFIARFREQIRLQRIESIKRSATAHISRNSSR